MIKITAKSFIKQDKLQEFIDLASQLVQETNSKDEGCISYELFQDVNAPCTMTFIEEWEDKEALDKHMASNHFTEIVPLLGAFSEKPGENNIYKKII